MVAAGLSHGQIAARLVLSHRTVQNHMQNTLGELQLLNRVELVRYAIEHGLAGEFEAGRIGSTALPGSLEAPSWKEWQGSAGTTSAISRNTVAHQPEARRQPSGEVIQKRRVRRQGLEPRTRRLRVCCSNQLS